MNGLNPVEDAMLNALLVARDLLLNPKTWTLRYRDVLGVIRTAIQMAENKAYGCASGRHAGECQCQENARPS